MNISSKKYLGSCLLLGFITCLQAEDTVGKPPKTGDELRVDNWVDTWMLAQQGPAGKPVEGKYAVRFDMLDTTDAKHGLFSVRFTVGKETGERACGFSSGPYLTHWELAGDFTLHAWIKAVAATNPQEWRIALFDTTGRKAIAALPKMAADGKWREIELPISKLKADEGFDCASVRSVQVEAVLPKDAQLWLDDVRFERAGEVLGVSDKTITQYMVEAAATHARRVTDTLSNPGSWAAFSLTAPLYNGKDLDAANKAIIEWTKTADEGSKNSKWTLTANSYANWLLFGFGSKGRIAPGRLSPEAERAVLAYYWEHCEVKNDIATARQSTWWVTGSENHDINFKSANLLSSQIFMHEQDYKKRIYPDLGRMQGYFYGDGGTFRVGVVSEKPKLGSGHYKDGKKYNAADHYQAWVSFWKEFFAERARHGFFIEHNASGYMLHTLRFLSDVYAWCEDAELRQQAKMFLDLVWAQWAQDQMVGINGGACSRGEPGYSRMSDMSEFFLGGPSGKASPYAFSDYQWPRQVWEIVLGRSQMGEYAFVSRKPGEAQDVWPQPPGTEYTMIVRPDSRMVRTSWVTPDYVMGTRMDHPDALYHHLGGAAEGITFSTGPKATIVWGGHHMAVQHRGSAVMQPKKSFRMQSPDWFPGYIPNPPEPKISFSADIDKIEEQDGWVFVQEGNAYVAFRFVYPATDTINASTDKRTAVPIPFALDEEGFGLFKPEPAPYTWKESKPGDPRMLEPKDPYAALIVEASRKPHHATLDAFKKDVLKNPIRMRQVIRSGYLLTYRGCGKEAKELYLNCSTDKPAKIGGEVLSYNCPTFDSPWLQGASGSGVVTLTGPLSGEKLVLDFNKASPKK
jgi:hypothetical protein